MLFRWEKKKYIHKFTKYRTYWVLLIITIAHEQKKKIIFISIDFL